MLSTAAEERLLQIVKQLRQLPIDIRISAHTSKLSLNQTSCLYIGKVPMLPVLERPLGDTDRMINNVVDRIVGLALLFETDTFEKIEQRVQHDLHYINNWSVLFDLRIIALTSFSLSGDSNAD